MCCGSGRKADGEHSGAVRKHSIGDPVNRTQQPETDREWISVPKPNDTIKEHKPFPESNPVDLLPAQTNPAVPAQKWWTSQIRGTKYPHPSPPAGRPEQRPLIQFSPPPTKPVFHAQKLPLQEVQPQVTNKMGGLTFKRPSEDAYHLESKKTEGYV